MRISMYFLIINITFYPYSCKGFYRKLLIFFYRKRCNWFTDTDMADNRPGKAENLTNPF